MKELFVHLKLLIVSVEAVAVADTTRAYSRPKFDTVRYKIGITLQWPTRTYPVKMLAKNDHVDGIET